MTAWGIHTCDTLPSQYVSGTQQPHKDRPNQPQRRSLYHARARILKTIRAGVGPQQMVTAQEFQNVIRLGWGLGWVRAGINTVWYTNVNGLSEQAVGNSDSE